MSSSLSNTSHLHLQQTPHHAVLLVLPEEPPSKRRALYTQPLRRALHEAAYNNNNQASTLDIAISLDATRKGAFELPRTRNHDYLQSLLATIYKLLAQLSLERDEGAGEIDLTAPTGVDARVFFVIDPPRDYLPYNKTVGDLARMGFDGIFHLTREQGPILELWKLADSWRLWTSYFSLATPEGEQVWNSSASSMVRRAFEDEKPEVLNHQRVSGEEIQNVGQLCAASTSSTDGEVVEKNSERHYSIAVGGTFDHLHIGHKLLLTGTALALDPVPFDHIDEPRRCITVGIMDDDLLVDKKYAEVLESWETRAMAVLDFLVSIIDFQPTPLNETNECSAATFGKNVLGWSRVPGANPTKKDIYAHLPYLTIKIVRLRDVYGPTLTDPDISVLLVSHETRKGGQATNDARRKRGLGPMKILEVGVLEAGGEGDGGASAAKEDEFASKISSTEIRRRIMNA